MLQKRAETDEIIVSWILYYANIHVMDIRDAQLCHIIIMCSKHISQLAL